MSPDERRRIDQVCDRFEQAWKAGERPELAAYLDCEAVDSQELFRELLKVEVELRRQARESITLEEYLARWSQWREIVLEVYQAATRTRVAPDVVDAAVHIRCPHCSNPIELVEETELQDVTCPSCGSHFSLVDAQSTLPHAAGAPRRIGHFELRRQVGVGAFGSVWEAHDTILDRTVAVKIPRAGQIPPAEQEKFFREGRAAAQLRHPSIVAVHEVGRDGDTIYIISDFVRGLTLADWLTGQKPTPREAAALVEKIARALEHAHQKGVVHRDLKPSNIMLDENGEPHVMDFGLAKREAGEITMTMDGAVLGTPAYMSPEQARGEAHRVDGRSDVYSLGAILFELLTGECPFRGNARMLLYQVLNEEPRSPQSLNDRIPRDLETITLKCLDKDPGKRYSTANGLADDLHRYRHGELIVARPAGRFELAWRWARRRPMAAGFLALLGVSLVGLSSLVAMLFSTNHRLEKARALASTQGQLAQKRSKEAQGLVEDWFTSVSESKELKEAPGLQPLRKQLLERAKEYYQGAAREPDNTLRSETAESWFRLARVVEEVGDPTEAIAAYQHAATGARELLRDGEASDEAEHLLARSLNGLALVSYRTQKFDQALDAYRSSVEAQQRVVARRPEEWQLKRELARILGNLAALMHERGETQDAEQTFQESLGILGRLYAEHAEDPTVASEFAHGLYNRSAFLYRQSNPSAASQPAEEALRIREQLVATYPTSMQFRAELAASHCNVGAIRFQCGKIAEGIDAFRQAIKLQERLMLDNPAVASYASDCARTHVNLATLLRRLEKISEATTECSEGQRILRRLVQDYPTVVPYQIELAICHDMQGKLERLNRDYGAAETDSRKAIAIVNALHAEHPEHTQFSTLLASFYHNLANILDDQGRLDESVKTSLESVRLAEGQLALVGGADRSLIMQIGDTHRNIALTYRNAGRSQEEIASYRTALGAYARLDESSMSKAQLLLAMAETQSSLGAALERAGSSKESLSSFEDAVQSFARAIDEEPLNRDARKSLAETYHNVAVILSSMSRHPEAVSQMRKAVAIPEQLVAENPDDQESLALLGECHGNLGRVCGRANMLSESETHFLAALDIYGELRAPTPEVLLDAAKLNCGIVQLIDTQAQLPRKQDRSKLIDQALRHLKAMIEWGGCDPTVLESAEDLAPLRQHPVFLNLVDQLKVEPASVDTPRDASS